MKHIVALIILFLVVIFAGGITGVFFPQREGFTPSYNQCMSQGYSKEFCVQTPTNVFGPGACRCYDGRIGRRLPGFRGGCVCF